MLARFKDAAMNVLAKRSVEEKMLADSQEESARNNNSAVSGQPKPEKYFYGRPYFLSLDKDEVQSAIDFGTRPILTPRKVHDMPLVSGYAECLNGGKSSCNEDNSYACEMHIKSKCIQNGKTLTMQKTPLPKMQPMQDFTKLPTCIEAVYFGMFDGHAGHQTSLIVSRQLHSILQELLSECVELLAAMAAGGNSETSDTEPALGVGSVTEDDIVVGALEEAFQLMDYKLKIESERYNVRGGCTALVALFISGKLYVANAGDSRAVLCHGSTVKQVSTDFTPETEKQRINLKGLLNPELLHGEFCCLEFPRRVVKSDLSTRMLCRMPGTSGWKYKTIEEEDTKFPLVTGRGKNIISQARIMGTIGVSRGLGDHDLYIYESDISIKPFLSCIPEVKVIDLREEKYDQTDVLIMATDGFWDVVTNVRAAEIVRNEVQKSTSKDSEKTKYIIAAQRLVMEARGTFTGQGWKKSSGENASFDDISAFVIPIKKYQDIWKNKRSLENSVEAAVRS